MMSLYDLVGLTGVSLSVACYARVQWQRDYAKKINYSLLNLASALLLAISIQKDWNLAAFISNCVWRAISAYGIYRCLKYRHREQRAQISE